MSIRSDHWSTKFYNKCRAKGFLYAARAYRPNYMTGLDEPTDLQMFNNKEELYNLPFVLPWKNNKDVDRLVLECDSNDDGEEMLIAYMKDGRHRVVAFFMDLRNPARWKDVKWQDILLKKTSKISQTG